MNIYQNVFFLSFYNYFVGEERVTPMTFINQPAQIIEVETIKVQLELLWVDACTNTGQGRSSKENELIDRVSYNRDERKRCMSNGWAWVVVMTVVMAYYILYRGVEAVVGLL